MCRPILDAHTGDWQRKYNRELQKMLEIEMITNFIKG